MHFSRYEWWRLFRFPIIVYLINWVLIEISWSTYDRLSLDTPIHFVGGMSIAVMTAYLLEQLNRAKLVKINSFLFRSGVLISTTALAAVVWEVYEFMHDYLFLTTYQPSVADTMKDLVMGFFGAVAYCLWLWFTRKKVVRSFSVQRQNGNKSTSS